MRKLRKTEYKRTPPRKSGTRPDRGLGRRPDNAVVVGTGFVALDIVIAEGREARTWAGGTCGNVLAILAYLGWRAYPISALGQDAAAERIIEDLSDVGVNTRFVQRDGQRRTPIVIERIRPDANGTPRSRFAWTCPGCGAWLPGYQAVLAKETKRVIASMPDPRVFFFDRVSRGALDLAAAARKVGALVVFEPSGVRDERLFREALALSHVLKYSHERLSGIAERLTESAPLLEIETLGSEGLRYRWRGRSKTDGWRLMEAYGVPELTDTVGAGDWCTAGFAHVLGSEGALGIRNTSQARVERALRTGQALAALACAYEGARGVMYALKKTQFRAAIAEVMEGGTPISRKEQPDTSLQELWKAVCPECGAEQRGSARG